MPTERVTHPGSKGRKRGGPRRISREGIVEAARGLDPQSLTMQAVADQLGVDRKALNYHVTDREGLLRLVAADVFETTSAEAFKDNPEWTESPLDNDWRAGIRAWAVTVRDSMVATGIVSHYRPLGGESLSVLRPAEVVLQQLLRAGFDLATAGRGLTFVTNFSMGVARDIIMENQHGEHPQATEVKRLLELDRDNGGHNLFRDLAALDINSPRDIAIQFDFEMDVFIAGMEHRLLKDLASTTGESRP